MYNFAIKAHKQSIASEPSIKKGNERWTPGGMDGHECESRKEKNENETEWQGNPTIGSISVCLVISMAEFGAIGGGVLIHTSSGKAEQPRYSRPGTPSHSG